MNKKGYARRCIKNDIDWIKYVEGAMELQLDYFTRDEYETLL